MSRLSMFLAAASLAICFNASAQGTPDAAEARKAADSWMKLVDAEEYSAAWNTSAEGMRKGMPKIAWNMLASTVHMPLGALKSRSFKSAEAKPGKPDSVSLEYVANYENSANVRENVTAVREADGVWRVSGFNISTEESKKPR